MKNGLQMKAQPINVDEKNVFQLELLRFLAYGESPDNIGETLYSIGLLEGRMLAFGFYINGQLVAGCYVSNNENSLYIEQLFVHPMLHGSSIKVGRLLLRYVLSKKEEIGKHYETSFEYSTLDYVPNEKVRQVYEELDYEVLPNNQKLQGRTALMQKRLN